MSSIGYMNYYLPEKRMSINEFFDRHKDKFLSPVPVFV